MRETGKTAPHTRRDADGFTLIEMLVVLAIVGLMAALIPPLTQGQRERAQVRSAANMLLADIRAAKQAALNSRQDTTISFAASGDRYLRSYDKKITAFPRQTVAQLQPREGSAQNNAADSGSIVFRPDGTTTGGMIRLSSGVLSKTISVSWPFGHVSHD